MSLLIKYNGKTIATLEKGQTATLVCEDKKMLSDVVVAMDGGSSANLISFTIEGTTHHAEDGMTWEQWVKSEYNTIGAFEAGLNVRLGDYVLEMSNYPPDYVGYKYVWTSHPIFPHGEYYWVRQTSND